MSERVERIATKVLGLTLENTPDGSAWIREDGTTFAWAFNRNTLEQWDPEHNPGDAMMALIEWAELYGGIFGFDGNFWGKVQYRFYVFVSSPEARGKGKSNSFRDAICSALDEWGKEER